MGKFFDKDGNEVEAFTADEHNAGITQAVAAKETEFGTKLTEAEKKLAEKDAALAARASEFGQFRKLNEETLAKLSEAERALYDNQLAAKKAEDERVAREKAAQDAAIDAAIKRKAGENTALQTKMKEMWSVIGVEAITPEQIEQKTAMVLGAIGSTQPDLVASVPGFNGSHLPPQKQQKEGESFADTERGKAAANELGLKIELPKQQQ